MNTTKVSELCALNGKGDLGCLLEFKHTGLCICSHPKARRHSVSGISLYANSCTIAHTSKKMRKSKNPNLKYASFNVGDRVEAFFSKLLLNRVWLKRTIFQGGIWQSLHAVMNQGMWMCSFKTTTKDLKLTQPVCDFSTTTPGNLSVCPLKSCVIPAFNMASNSNRSSCMSN